MRVVHKDLVDKGFMVRLENMDEYKRNLIEEAPFLHFNPWRLVMKIDSVTSPVRMVVDPSMILAKGEKPNWFDFQYYGEMSMHGTYLGLRY